MIDWFPTKYELRTGICKLSKIWRIVFCWRQSNGWQARKTRFITQWVTILFLIILVHSLHVWTLTALSLSAFLNLLPYLILSDIRIWSIHNLIYTPGIWLISPNSRYCCLSIRSNNIPPCIFVLYLLPGLNSLKPQNKMHTFEFWY